MIERTLGKYILEASEAFYIILLTGPRQVGKTTLLQSIQEEGRSYVSLDDLDMRAAAEQDPAAFIERLQLPVLIDEVQHAPSLFSYIKKTVDASKQKGLFWLTGSQQFAMMKNVSESLAGRVAIFDMHGISLAEELNRSLTPPFLPTLEVLKARQKQGQRLTQTAIFHKIWRGSYPHVVLDDGKTWERFYQSYITTYVERDVRDYLKIDDLVAFRRFMQVAAARTGQMLNFREVSKEVGVSEPTIKSWFNVLEATGLIVFIQPYHNNLTKRLVKTPKFYFMDTGLCCYLTGWLNQDVLEKGAMAGAMLETYVIAELIKSYRHHGRMTRFYYYADKEKREVDLLIEEGGVLHPIEIKKSSSIRNMHFKGFDFLSNLKTEIGPGCVLCFCESLLPISKGIEAVPIGYL